MKSAIFVAVLLMVGVCVNAQSQPSCDSTTGLTDEQCEDYTEQGAIYVTFDNRQSTLLDSEIEHFKEVMANITDDYVILPVLPEHVVIVQRGRNSETNEFMLRFFILNPSGSTVMPVALRRQELYLMIDLNNQLVNERLGMDITAQEPPSGYPLALPAWAIATLGYVGLIILIYCIMVLTRDWRNKKMMDFEAELEKNYYESTEGMKGGEDANGDIAMKKLPPANDNNYAVVDEVSTKKTAEIGVQTPRHVAVQVDPDEVINNVSTSDTKPASTIQAVIENGGSDITTGDPHYASVSQQSDQPAAADADTDAEGKEPKEDAAAKADDEATKEADDAAAAIEGAVNEGFTADETPQPSTQL